MKPLIWLTVWQAVAVNVQAIPHRRRHMVARQAADVCEEPATSTQPNIYTVVLPDKTITFASGNNQPGITQGQLTAAGVSTVAGNNGGLIVQTQSPATILVPQAGSGNPGNSNPSPTAVTAQPAEAIPSTSAKFVATNTSPAAIAASMRTVYENPDNSSPSPAAMQLTGASGNSDNPAVENTTPAASRDSAQASNDVPTRTESTDAYRVIWIGEETPATGISVVAGEQTPENVIFAPETVLVGSEEGICFAPITTSTVIPSVSVLTTATTQGSDTGTAQVIKNTPSTSPATKGTIVTSLGHSASAPVITGPINSPTSLLSATTTSAHTHTTSVMVSRVSDNIFQPVETVAPPSVISSRSDHPVPRLSITPQNSPIGTNKFYANFFLGSQTAGTWTHPYSVAWSKGGGTTGSWGMAIAHIDSNQKVFGPDAGANPAHYFINPIGIQSIVLSEAGLGSSTSISIDSITAFSANVNLSPRAGAQPSITFPLVQGMAFVTGIYSGGTPILQSGVFFASVTRANTSPKSGITKYSMVLNDGKKWLLYAYSPSGDSLSFTVVSNGLVQATSNFNGIIQIAKDPGGGAEALYDAACGVYATTATLSGSVTGDTASYKLSFSKAGMAGTTLAMFALPHHVQSFAPGTTLSTVQLDTTTKGKATAIVADSWTLVENIPTTMGFAPWSPSLGSQSTLSPAVIASILTVATSEVSQNMNEQTNLNSMYYSGKALAKFAGIVYTIHDLLGATALAEAGLTNLKASFAVFASNRQIYPLVHETAWGGVVSSASYTTGNSGEDFGNTYYNDHHFHYGYFIYAAAIIGYLDPSWVTNNKAYVNTLVRDIANPSTADNYFPVSRNFDWYHGHSWAHGLYETFDGKDEESSSEDSMSAYAIKMWGRTIGDSNMEARGNLQLAVTARALQNYFLYTSDNKVEPSNFIGNKVSGILFENKIDHTTYFGNNVEYIEGIHMLPLLPSSTLTRTKEFVTEEWNTYFSSGRVDSVVGGWRGILYANLGIIQPSAAWNFFSSSNFDVSFLDGGASRTWYMALAAGWGGAS